MIFHENKEKLERFVKSSKTPPEATEETEEANSDDEEEDYEDGETLWGKPDPKKKEMDGPLKNHVKHIWNVFGNDERLEKKDKKNIRYLAEEILQPNETDDKEKALVRSKYLEIVQDHLARSPSKQRKAERKSEQHQKEYMRSICFTNSFPHLDEVTPFFRYFKKMLIKLGDDGVKLDGMSDLIGRLEKYDDAECDYTLFQQYVSNYASSDEEDSDADEEEVDEDDSDSHEQPESPDSSPVPTPRRKLALMEDETSSPCGTIIVDQDEPSSP